MELLAPEELLPVLGQERRALLACAMQHRHELQAVAFAHRFQRQRVGLQNSDGTEETGGGGGAVGRSGG
jgi:hypothetical protein